MKFFFKDSKHRPNLFSSAAYFMVGKDADLFGHFDYGLRLVQSNEDFFIAQSGWEPTSLGTDETSHKVDFSAIKNALETNEFIIVGASKPEGVVFSNNLAKHIKYIARSRQDPDRRVDALTGNFVDIQHPISALMFVVKVPHLDAAICYMDPMFLKVGSLIETTAEFEEVYKYPGDVRDFLLNPKFSNASLVAGALLTTNTFELTILEGFSEEEVDLVLDSSRVITSLTYQRIPYGFRIAGNKANGFFKLVPDFGLLSKLHGENCVLEFVIKNMSGAFM